MKEQLQNELDQMQMNYIKRCTNIEDVQSLIEFFAKMNDVVKNSKGLEEISLSGGTGGMPGGLGEKPKRAGRPRGTTNTTTAKA